MNLDKLKKRNRRHHRVRAKIVGTDKMPRLCVFKSSQHIYAQIIDDTKGKTIFQVSDLKKLKIKPSSRAQVEGNEKLKKMDKAFEVGKEIAKLAIEKKIKKVVFDRGGFKYHGRIKAVAEGAREAGLVF